MVTIPPGLATPDDVQKWMGRPLSEAERNLSAVLVDGVARKILARIPNLADLLAKGRRDPETVVMVQALSVCRVLRNPDGYRTESAGTFSYTVDSRVAAGFLTILPDEWRDLGVDISAQVAPATDAYLATRRPQWGDRSWWFQNGWPACDEMADRCGGFW
ncbi:Gp19/Gp15/Gp42 family protein [Nocardia brasiliensis]|uniref:Gp19/Gp15/Gp42 family protein n=1 Tax=Nocardia brasiliensis TaxID=37326 RepID=UPI00245809BB|nr:Gp19/Gp15/Gp42 family protein [Nocardia brasiliensis]